MILGFGEKRQTVSEADALPGEEFIVLEIFITSLRISEIPYRVGVRSVIEGEPIVEPSFDIQNVMVDGVFGSREENTINNLVTMEELRVNTSMLSALQVTIRDDNLPEEEECFEMSIFPVNPDAMSEIFLCNMVGTEFLCKHKICIVDNDG